MNLIELNISPLALIGFVLFFIVIFIAMLIRLYRNVRYLRNRKNTQHTKIKDLRLSKMLNYSGIPFTHYLRNTNDLEKERHIWVCENCPNPELCEKVFAGENVDVAAICPNHPRLQRLQPD